MQKKFLWTLGLLSFFVSVTARALPYDDQFGNPAPTSVRRSADGLLEVDRLRHEVGWVNHYTQTTAGCCGAIETHTYCNNVMPKDRRPMPPEATQYFPTNVGVVPYKSADHKFKEALLEFKRVLNQHVINPVPYEGDIVFGWTETTYTTGETTRDMSLESVVLSFVNKQGGWVKGYGATM